MSDSVKLVMDDGRELNLSLTHFGDRVTLSDSRDRANLIRFYANGRVERVPNVNLDVPLIKDDSGRIIIDGPPCNFKPHTLRIDDGEPIVLTQEQYDQIKGQFK